MEEWRNGGEEEEEKEEEEEEEERESQRVGSMRDTRKSGRWPA